MRCLLTISERGMVAVVLDEMSKGRIILPTQGMYALLICR